MMFTVFAAAISSLKHKTRKVTSRADKDKASPAKVEECLPDRAAVYAYKRNVQRDTVLFCVPRSAELERSSSASPSSGSPVSSSPTSSSPVSSSPASGTSSVLLLPLPPRTSSLPGGQAPCSPLKAIEPLALPPRTSSLAGARAAGSPPKAIAPLALPRRASSLPGAQSARSPLAMIASLPVPVVADHEASNSAPAASAAILLPAGSLSRSESLDSLASDPFEYSDYLSPLPSPTPTNGVMVNGTEVVNFSVAQSAQLASQG